jgi:hypothetical protein
MKRSSLAACAGSLAAMALVLGGCSGQDESTAAPSGADVVRMWVEPERVDCVGVAPMECLQVAYSEGGDTQLFYDSIEGFEYEEGTAYVLDVRVSEVADPPADGSSLAYTLVTVVSAVPQ